MTSRIKSTLDKAMEANAKRQRAKYPKATRTPVCRCLGCDRKIDSTTNMTGPDRPHPSDITICLYCGHIMAFADDLSMRNLTDQEMLDVAGDENILRVQRARVEALKNKKID